MSADPTRPYPAGWDQPAYQAPRRRRRRRGPLIGGITLIVILILLVVGDRVANAIAENQMASQIEANGFPAKPNVTIDGFPFLTQLIAHDFKNVNISAHNVTDGSLEISTMNATLHGMHINSGYSSAKVDQINGSALITFSELANAGDIPGGIQLSQDGPNEIKATINVVVFTGTAIARVTPEGSDAVNVQIVSSSDIPSSVLGNLANFTVKLPKLPAGMTIQSVTVTSQGVLITIAAHDTTLSQ